MHQLRHDEVLKITRSSVLFATHAHVLSDFEQTLVAEIGQRFVRFGRSAEVTPHEWPVLLDALAAMTRDRGSPPTCPEGAPPAARGVPSSRRNGDEHVLNKEAFSNINKVLSALVNAGGVRPEDEPDVSNALAALKAAEEADASAISDLQAKLADYDQRIAALETGVNGVVNITVTPPTNLTAQVGVSYSGVFSASGGKSPYQFDVVDGHLVGGLSLNATTGELAGTPETEGSFSFSVDASDADEVLSDPVTVTLIVAAATPVPVETQPGQSSGGDTVTQAAEPAAGTTQEATQTATQAAKALA